MTYFGVDGSGSSAVADYSFVAVLGLECYIFCCTRVVAKRSGCSFDVRMLKVQGHQRWRVLSISIYIYIIYIYIYIYIYISLIITDGPLPTSEGILCVLS